MSFSRALAIAVLLVATAVQVGGETCTPATDATFDAPYRGLLPAPPVPVVPYPVPYWILTDDGEPFEFQVSLTLEKYIPDGEPPCDFLVGSWIIATLEITNLSDQTYDRVFRDDKVMEIYFVDAITDELVYRFSDDQPYVDGRERYVIPPGATYTDRRWWRPDGLHAPILPAGMYRAHGRFEPGRPPPFRRRADLTWAPAITFRFD